MMRKENMWKAVVSGALLLTVIATGAAMYSTSDDKEKKEPKTDMELVENNYEKEQMEKDHFESHDVSGNSVIAENYENMEKPNVSDNEPIKPVEIVPEAKNPEDSTNTSGPALPVLNFTEDSVMVWPVSGEVLIDYSMDTTTYFPTLNQYKCSDGLVLGSEIGTAVQAAATGDVISIVENEETGLTMLMDLGNGYQAIYGQLKDVRVDVGERIEKGVILGYVDEPTKYFVKEGSNLYFSMTKDGVNVDPMIYLETVTE